MNWKSAGLAIVVIAASLALLSPAVRAVILAGTGDPTYNTTAPGGTLTNSGWQWEGTWGSYLGTPIAPTFFLAAGHVGGSIGQTFSLNGFVYHTVTNYPDPLTDLEIWQVAETFPDYAPLFSGTNEPGQACAVFGRGTQRGVPVVVNPNTNGWQWGTSDGQERWGQNTVASIYVDPTYGELLQCAFVRNAGSNECHLSDGDSSGALFIQVGSTWNLAGINLAVDGPFSFNGTTNTEFYGALFDMGGLYVPSAGTDWTYIVEQTNDTPSSFYCTRVSDRLSWIYSVINFEPGPDLRITQIGCVSGDAVVSFITTTGRVYAVDYCNDLTTSSWTALTNGIVGTGSVMDVHDPGACGLLKRFYRLLLIQ